MSEILRLPQVVERTRLSRSAIYRLMAKGLFPKAVSLGERAVGWKEEAIQQWIESRPSRQYKLPED